MEVPASKKRLLVEGNDDLYAVAELMGQHVAWGQKPEERPVKIKEYGGAPNILKQTTISTELKSPEVSILGIIIDADDKCDARWDSLRSLCGFMFPHLPEKLPTGGLIADDPATGWEGKRLGVWIMPDNQSRGMLETFMKFLVPDAQNPLWLHAEQSVKEAANKGAPYKKTHQEKRIFIHGWHGKTRPPKAWVLRFFKTPLTQMRRMQPHLFNGFVHFFTSK